MDKASTLVEKWKNKSSDKAEKQAGSFYVAGVTFENRQEVLKELEEEYFKISVKKLARFVPEPDNQYDKNAIKVEVEVEPENWKCIGYVPKTVNQDFQKIIDSGRLLKSKIASIGRPESDKPLGAKVVYEVDLSE